MITVSEPMSTFSTDQTTITQCNTFFARLLIYSCPIPFWHAENESDNHFFPPSLVWQKFEKINIFWYFIFITAIFQSFCLNSFSAGLLFFISRCIYPLSIYVYYNLFKLMLEIKFWCLSIINSYQNGDIYRSAVSGELQYIIF